MTKGQSIILSAGEYVLVLVGYQSTTPIGIFALISLFAPIAYSMAYWRKYPIGAFYMKWYYSYIKEVFIGAKKGHQSIAPIGYFAPIGYIALITYLIGYLHTQTFLIIWNSNPIML